MIRGLVQTILVLLFGVFGPGATMAAQGDWSQASYPTAVHEFDVHGLNLTNTARAPPTTSANVTFTGNALALTGETRSAYGSETRGLAYALLRSANAVDLR